MMVKEMLCKAIELTGAKVKKFIAIDEHPARPHAALYAAAAQRRQKSVLSDGAKALMLGIL